MIAVATTMLTIPVTTAEVVASPTAEALRPLRTPRRHPASATSTPNTALMKRPRSRSLMRTACFVSSRYCIGPTSSIELATTSPPAIPIRSA